MKQNSKLRQDQQQEATHQQHSDQTIQSKDFSSVEEMLRYDATMTEVPLNLADKVNRSVAGQPAVSSWWQRLKLRLTGH